jgi:hypothetical protein
LGELENVLVEVQRVVAWRAFGTRVAQKKAPSFPMKAIAISLLSLLPLAASVRAGTETTSAVEPAAPQSRVHFLLQVDVSDHYITPRGLNVENEGVVFQPLLLSFWNLYSDKSSFVNDVSLTLGMWSSVHTEVSGPDPGHWNEWDPIFGLSLGLGDYVKFETNYTAFKSMVDAYPTSHHLELKLKLDDSKWLGAFALNPYVAFWKELDNKATVVFDPTTSDESYYFTVGINPSVKAGPVKFEFPTYINIVDSEFYQQMDGSDGGSGIAVFGTEIKASVPLMFIPQEYGFWTAYAGVKYYHLGNKGLKDGNIVLGGGDRDDLVQFHAGLSIFF